jgi:hypothetical protein
LELEILHNVLIQPALQAANPPQYLLLLNAGTIVRLSVERT